MAALHFNDFRDVFSTAAGIACRCARSDLASTIATLAPGATLWSSSAMLTADPALQSELEALGLSLLWDGDPAAVRDQAWGLTTARAAIAESGSVVLVEPRLEQRSVSLMTTALIVLCPMSELYPSLDDAAPILREVAAEGTSYATLVSGPSRTADIERHLTIGVQGPGEVHVIFVEQPPSTRLVE